MPFGAKPHLGLTVENAPAIRRMNEDCPCYYHGVRANGKEISIQKAAAPGVGPLFLPAQRRATFCAWGPLGLWTISKTTGSP